MTLSAHNHCGSWEPTETRCKLSSDSRDLEVYRGLSFANLCNLDAEGDLCQREGREANICSQCLHFKDGCNRCPKKIDGFALQNFSRIREYSCVVRNACRKAEINNAPSSNFGLSTKRVRGSGTEAEDARNCYSGSREPKGQELGLLAERFNFVARGDSSLKS